MWIFLAKIRLYFIRTKKRLLKFYHKAMGHTKFYIVLPKERDGFKTAKLVEWHSGTYQDIPVLTASQWQELLQEKTGYPFSEWNRN